MNTQSEYYEVDEKMAEWPEVIAQEKNVSRFIKMSVVTDDGPLFIKAGYSYHKGNSRPYWSVTANGRGRAGCLHDEILQHAPELAPIVEVHLMSIDGNPMYFKENGVYRAKQLVCLMAAGGESYFTLLKSAVRDKKNVDEVITTEKKKAYGMFMSHFLNDPRAVEAIDFLVGKLEYGLPDSDKANLLIETTINKLADELKPMLVDKSEQAYQTMKRIAREQKEPTRETLAQALEKLNVKVFVDDLAFRSDNLWAAHDNARHYTITVVRRVDDKELSIDFEFSVGSAIVEVTEVMALEGLLSDVSMVESCGDFENFCRTCGFDTDSRKALATWEALEERELELQAMFTQEELEALQLTVEDEANATC